MKKILLLLSTVILFSVSAQEKTLEEIATDVVNLDKRKKEKETEENSKVSNNLLEMEEEKFNKLKTEFLEHFADCRNFSKTFKLPNNGRGHLSIRGTQEKTNRKHEVYEVCVIDVKIINDFAEYCQYPKSEIIIMYGYYSREFFKKGYDNTRNSTKNCRRFY